MNGWNLCSHNPVVYRHLSYRCGSIYFLWGNCLQIFWPVIGCKCPLLYLYNYTHGVKSSLVNFVLLFIMVAGLPIDWCIHIVTLVFPGRSSLCHIMVTIHHLWIWYCWRVVLYVDVCIYGADVYGKTDNVSSYH